MRQLYAYDPNESTRRLVEDGMSTGLTSTHTALGFSVLYHVFARKQCIFSSASRHKSYPWSLRDSFCVRAWLCNAGCSLAIGHLHDGVILLLWPGSFGVLLSCANLGFCYLNLTGATEFKYEKKTKIILVVVVKWRHRANGPLQIFPGKHAPEPPHLLLCSP